MCSRDQHSNDEQRRCPKCGYALGGLPREHACPECGIDYDADAVVIELRANYNDYRQLKYAFLCLIALYLAMRRSRLGDGYYDWLILIGLLLVPLVFRLARHAGVSYLVLNRFGIQFDHPQISSTPIDWSDISQAKRSWMSGHVSLLDTSGDTLFRFPGQWIGNPRIVRRCVREINRLLPLYGANES